jgi:hypothetical protein
MAGVSIDRLKQGDWSSAVFWGLVLAICCLAAWAVHRVVMVRMR